METPFYALYLVSESSVDLVGTTLTRSGAQRLKSRLERRELRPIQRLHQQHGLQTMNVEYRIVKV